MKAKNKNKKEKGENFYFYLLFISVFIQLLNKYNCKLFEYFLITLITKTEE
jgi:hypothetical protein